MYKSETDKYRHLTTKYCYTSDGVAGCGADIASQGDSVVPWAMALDLPLDEFNVYCGNVPAKGPIQLRGHGEALPFDNDSLDFLYSSHLLEDYLDWEPVLKEWTRVVKPGGYLIILLPEKDLWAKAVANGQPQNAAHKHEGRAGELSSYAPALGLEVIEDRLTDCFPDDYSIIGVFKKC